MEFAYTAFTQDRKLVKGKVSAASERDAAEALNSGGYRIISLKQSASLLKMGSFSKSFGATVKHKDIIMFSRQLALLIESGTDIINSLGLLQKQMPNRAFRDVIDKVSADIRSGTSLSTAMAKHPKVFPQMYYHAIAASEQGGNLELVLRQVSDYMERQMLVRKKIKSAMTYPIVMAVMAVGVVGVMVTFVLPNFVSLFGQFGAKLPPMTKLMISVADTASKVGPYVILALLVVMGVAFAYIRTPAGRFKFHSFLLRMPMMGKIFVLNELSRACRTIALLFRVGLPLPEILTLVINGTTNRAMAKELTEVQQELIRGEGLSQPMAKRKVFLPLMVQMVAVGEETGNLDNALTTVAIAYESESDDRTSAALGLIQPMMTVGIGLVIMVVALTLVTTMYGIYGQLDF
ncbi:MAG: type II secretion system F family protein [Chloroflexi bacterium]|nr:type II secretion system F family protein [Chloroflexota bacterium]